MSVISESEAAVILDPHMERLGIAFAQAQSAWQEFTNQMPLMARDVRSRGQSNLLYELITAEAERQFRAVPGVKVKHVHGFLTLTFGDQLVLRIKKFRRGRMYETYGAATRQRQLWEGQQALPDLPPEATNAVAGYLMDALKQRFVGVWVACRKGRYLEWVIQVPENAAVVGFPAPADPGELPAPTVRARRSREIPETGKREA
jgi:hypothetical protein